MFEATADTVVAVAHAVGDKRQRPAGATRLDDAKFFNHVDAHAGEYVARLAEFVAIPSVSAEPERRGDVERAVLWYQACCDRLGATTTLERVGTQTLQDGTALPLPPVLLASWGDPAAEPDKPTLVVYGHLDVQPAAKEDGWNTEPFELTEVDGRLHGRGASDDKGPALAWLWAVEAYRALGVPLPVHLRCVFEGMEESGSLGLPDLVRRLGAPGGHLDPLLCEYVCISDNYYVGSKPCLTHGLRGNVYFFLEVKCSERDMHSGVIGGSVHEAMTDLVKMLATLVDCSGKITIAGIEEQVAPLAPGELEGIEGLDFDEEAYKTETGVASVSNTLLHEGKVNVLTHRWRYPTLSIHGVQGAFHGPGSKTVIPGCVTGKFSLRLVPDMHPEKVEAMVRSHVAAEWAKLGSPNQMRLSVEKASFPWHRQPDAPNFAAAAAATRRVHGVDPKYTREGGSIPITQVFEDVCDACCVLLPIGASDDGAHSQNEKIDRGNYLAGIKTLGCYMDELADLPKRAAAATGEDEGRQWRRRCRKDLTRFGCECLECADER